MKANQPTTQCYEIDDMYTMKTQLSKKQNKKKKRSQVTKCMLLKLHMKTTIRAGRTFCLHNFCNLSYHLNFSDFSLIGHGSILLLSQGQLSLCALLVLRTQQMR